MTEQYYIGLMSGTSLDGVDAALVAFESSSKLRLVATHLHEFEAGLRAEINHTAQHNTHLSCNEDSALHAKLAPVYADACSALLEKAGVKKSQIHAIANHGQTVKHEPNAHPPYSLQLGDAQLIANLSGIKTIALFRQADIAAGGQGAPLMPAFHAALFGKATNTFVLNIGGIANLTRLHTPLVGFDTGPGNVLLDQWVALNRNTRYDKDGAWAASGQSNSELLAALLDDDFFTAPHPKSTGTDYFNIAWVRTRYPNMSALASADIQATLLALTIESIAQQIEQLSTTTTDSIKLYVCGGGAKNSILMQTLAVRLKNAKVQTTDDLGVPADWLEAIGFAWLGYCHEHGIASNCPSVTGAQSEVVLGRAFLPQ